MSARHVSSRDDALALLDATFERARSRGPELALTAISAGVPLAFSLLALYFFERVEGARGLRLPFAFLIVASYLVRTYFISSAAAGYIGEARRVTWRSAARASASAGLFAWAWAWFLGLASFAGPFGFLIVLPILALRGAIAPSEWARVGSGDPGGFKTFATATSDSTDLRLAGAVVELALLFGGAVLALNLFLFVGAGLAMMRIFLGVDVTSLVSFLSFNNPFATLAITLIAYTALEPLRASFSAIVYERARARRDGRDLRELIAEAAQSRRFGDARKAMLVLVAALAFSPLAQAQPALPPPPDQSDPVVTEAPARFVPPPPLPGRDLSPREQEAVAEAERILAAREYQEFEDGRGKRAFDIVDGLFRYLRDLLENVPRPDAADLDLRRLPMPPTWVFGVLALALVAVVVAVLVAGRGRGAPLRAKKREVPEALSKSPEEHLDDAGALAARGDHRAALRALYLATLGGLDRRRHIRFDPTKTNWHYSRQIREPAVRATFERFTSLFDHKWYGDEPTQLADYQAGRALADELATR